MESKLRELVNEVIKKEGLESTDENIFEFLRAAKTLKEYDRDKHRWYTLYRRVVKFGDFFIDFVYYESKGDEPAFDREEAKDLVLSSIKQVFPHEKTIIDYTDKP